MTYLSGSSALPSLSQIRSASPSPTLPALPQFAPQSSVPGSLTQGDTLQQRKSTAPAGLPGTIPSVSYLLTVQELHQQEGYLKLGDQSEAVGFVQERLQKWGYDLKADQKFGPETFQAVSDFQRKHGLEISGMVGELTLNVLESDPVLRPQALPSLPALPSAQPGDNLSPVRQGQAYLQTGDQGPAVEQIQTLLKARGYDLTVDGDYGDKTAAAVAKFQCDHTIQANGLVGRTTLAALEAKPAPAPQIQAIQQGLAVLSAGAQGQAVDHIQERLAAWGYYGHTVDGDFGPLTAEAIRSFQRDHNIQANGQVGPTTLAALEHTPPPSVGLIRPTARGARLGKVAEQVGRRRGTVGWCYAGAADSVSRALGVSLWGKSAYMAADILRRLPGFREYKNLKPSDLPKLPAGAIVVWGKTSVSPHGHISIALGDGRESSDHLAKQMTSLRGHTNFSVFMPV